jgi:hypothetical protein
MSADQDLTGDYGYDLAHEMKAAWPIPSPRAPLRAVGAAARTPREPDPHSDWSYDQAHEF